MSSTSKPVLARHKLNVRRRPPQPSSSFLTASAPTPALPHQPIPAGTGLLPLQQHSTNDVADMRLLVERVTNGFTLSEHALAQDLGWSRYLERQLHPELIDDSLVENALAGLETLNLGTEDLYLNYQDDSASQPAIELLTATMVRSVYSTRQLHERMVEFWSDHFNVYQLDDLAIWWKNVDDREVIREHALGKFPDMLRASARSAAMLWYLDNYANFVGAAQENYARELMELHTLGVDGPYTEQDVLEVARCFTGWTFHGVVSIGTLGKFVFIPELHDPGQKEVLGTTIPALGGIDDGERVLDLLAMNPSTAQYISRKMCNWLLYADTPQDVVDRVARTYLNTGGDIKAMIRVILNPINVLRVNRVRRLKLRRPRHLVSSLMRSSLAGTSNPLQLIYSLNEMGHVPFWWPAPDGYPDSAESWGQNLLPRWKFAQRFFDGQIPGNTPSPAVLSDLLQSFPPGQYARAIDNALTGGRMNPRDVADVQSYIDAQPVFNGQVMREAFALAASSPSYQYF